MAPGPVPSSHSNKQGLTRAVKRILQAQHVAPHAMPSPVRTTGCRSPAISYRGCSRGAACNEVTPSLGGRVCGQRIPPALWCRRPRLCPAPFTTHLHTRFALNSTKPPEPQLPSQVECVLECSASSQLSHKPIQQFLFKGCCLCPCGKCIYCFGFLLLCAKVQAVLYLLLHVMVCPRHTSTARSDAKIPAAPAPRRYPRRSSARCSGGCHGGAAPCAPPAPDKQGNS